MVGKAKVKYVGSAAEVMPQSGTNWDYIYDVSLVQSEQFNIGDRAVLPDGREFRYGKSSAECASGQGAEFVFTGVQSYANVSVSQVVGDRTLTVTAGTHSAIAKDQLRGGYAITWPGAKKDQFRGIIGNDASAENAAIKVYLDGPLTVAVTAATTGCEFYQNPYGSLRTGSSASLGKAGVPAVYVSAANMYFWVQVKGPVFVAPQSDVINNHTGCYFRHDGSVESEIDFEDKSQANNSTQYAGYRMIGNYAGNGPLFNLSL